MALASCHLASHVSLIVMIVKKIIQRLSTDFAWNHQPPPHW